MLNLVLQSQSREQTTLCKFCCDVHDIIILLCCIHIIFSVKQCYRAVS